MSKFQYTNINTVLSKFHRDFRDIDINETDAIEWVGEALGFIKAPSALEEHVAFMEVKDYQCSIPEYLVYITQIARNTKGVTEVCSTEEDEEVNDNVISNGGSFEPNLVAIDCHGQIIGDYDVAYYRPYYDLKWEYGLWTNNNFYKESYVPVRLSNNSFFNSLVCKEENYNSIYSSCRDEYTIVNNQLRFSFKEGVVAISYLKQPVDAEGYPMIPDDNSCITAINYYLLWKVFERMEYLQKQGAARLSEKAEAKWNKYIVQFKNSAMMPKGVDDYQDLMEQSRYLIPRFNRYYGYFGNLNTKESRLFNNPDYRNKRYFRSYHNGEEYYTS